jgi:hypothetical protein
MSLVTLLSSLCYLLSVREVALEVQSLPMTSDRKFSVSVSVSECLSVSAEISVENRTENRNALSFGFGIGSDRTEILVFRFKFKFWSITTNDSLTLLLEHIVVMKKKSHLSHLLQGTVKPVHNGHPWDPEKVAVVQRVAPVQGLVQNSR